MAQVVTGDLSLETTTTTGVGALSLLGTVAGHQTFAQSGVNDGDTVEVMIREVDANGNPNGQWERSNCTYSSASNTLTRTTVIKSSNSNALVNFAPGQKRAYRVATKEHEDLYIGLNSLAAATGTNTIYYRSAANVWSPVGVGSRLSFSGGSLNTADQLLQPVGTISAPSYSFASNSGYGHFFKSSFALDSKLFVGVGTALGSVTAGFFIARDAGDTALGVLPGSGSNLTLYSGVNGNLTLKTPPVLAGSGGSGSFVIGSGESYGAGYTSGSVTLTSGDGFSDANSGDFNVRTGVVENSAIPGNINFEAGFNGDFDSGTINFTMYVSGQGFHLSDTAVTFDVPLIVTGGITGVSDASDAATGIVGEYIESSIASGSAVSLTTATAKTVTSISLTAGDWIVDGVVAYKSAVTANTATNQSGISTTNNTIGALGTYCQDSPMAVLVADQAYTLPSVRISISATTTVYLIAKSTFTISTNAAYGQIKAIRASR